MASDVKTMRLRPLAAEHKLSRGLFEQLAEQIKSGRLAPGARLPTEQELTRAARVSRTVVREAVAALRAEGLVVTRQGVGAFVTAEPQRAPFRIDPDKLKSIDDIKNLTIQTNPAPVKVGDVATVTDTTADVTRMQRFNGKDAIGFSITK